MGENHSPQLSPDDRAGQADEAHRYLDYVVRIEDSLVGDSEQVRRNRIGHASVICQRRPRVATAAAKVGSALRRWQAALQA